MAVKTAVVVDKRVGSYVATKNNFIHGYNYPTQKHVIYYQLDLDNGSSAEVSQGVYVRLSVGDTYTYRDPLLNAPLFYLVLSALVVIGVVASFSLIFG